MHSEFLFRTELGYFSISLQIQQICP